MDGSVCRRKGCHLCCRSTVMELSRGDISRLEGAGHRDFTTLDRRLANKEGACIFLASDGRCRVYAIRPEGCRLYPLIMRLPERMPILDGDCPHRKDFAPTPEDMIALEGLVSRLEASI